MIIIIVIVAAFALALVAGLAWRSIQSNAVSGKEGMIDEIGVAIDDFVDGAGRVRVHGEIWQAESDWEIRKDERIRVIEVRRLMLTVVPLSRS